MFKLVKKQSNHPLREISQTEKASSQRLIKETTGSMIKGGNKMF